MFRVIISETSSRRNGPRADGGRSRGGAVRIAQAGVRARGGPLCSEDAEGARLCRAVGAMFLHLFDRDSVAGTDEQGGAG